MQRITPPAVPEQPVPVLDDAGLAALLGTCRGTTFENRCDTAMLRLLIDTGMFAGESWGLGVGDVDFDQAARRSVMPIQRRQGRIRVRLHSQTAV